MEEVDTACTIASPAGIIDQAGGRRDDEASRETETAVNAGPLDTTPPMTPPSTSTRPHRKTSTLSTTTEDDDDDDDPHPNHEEEDELEEDEDVLTPEDLLVKAVASSAVRNDSSQSSLAQQQQQEQQPKASVRWNGVLATDKDDDDRRHRDSSTSSNSSWVPSPTGWPTRDRHVALPGAFAAPAGQQALTSTTTTRGVVAAVNSNEEYYDDDANDDEADGIARRGGGIPPTTLLEATLVEDHSETPAAGLCSADVIHAELLESQEFTPASMSQGKAPPPRKRILLFGIVGVLLLALVISLTVWLTIATVDRNRKVTSNSTNEEVDDDEGNDSGDGKDGPFDPSREWRERGYDLITHHVAYVGWQTSRRCNSEFDEPAVRVECGSGNDNDDNFNKLMDAEIKVWHRTSIVHDECYPVKRDRPIREFECASLDFHDNATTTTNSTTTTHMARIVFSCAAYQNASSSWVARVFVPPFSGDCGTGNETDKVSMSVALALQRICPVGLDKGRVVPSSMTRCHGDDDDTDTFPVSLVDVENGRACHHQSEPCETDAEDGVYSCEFDAYLGVEDWNNSTDYDTKNDSSCPSLVLRPDATFDGLADLSQVYEQFFGNSSKIVDD